MKIQARVTITFLSLFILLSGVNSQSDPNSQRTYEETLIEFLKISGADPKDDAILNQMTIMFEGKISLDKKIYENLIDTMITNMIPIYKQHYSQETLEELILWFKTPLGTEFVKKNKQIALETLKLSSKMSMTMMKEITDKMKKDKID